MGEIPLLKIAITGNIASGKSKVEKFLEAKGFNVLDTDAIAHKLLEDEAVKKQIILELFGYDILENHKISRKKLAKIIFEDKNLRRKLEKILHPLIKDEVELFFRRCQEEALKNGENKKLAFVSVPLLFEAKFENLFDKIILIYADDKIRLERLMKRSNLSLEHAKNRLKIQMNQDEKKSLSDYVIYNEKGLEDLYQNIEKTLELL